MLSTGVDSRNHNSRRHLPVTGYRTMQVRRAPPPQSAHCRACEFVTRVRTYREPNSLHGARALHGCRKPDDQGCSVTAAPDAEWTPPTVFEEYRLVQPLGSGAMGQVYLAHDLLLERQVAVKFVRAAGDPAARTRFFDEARAIARLQHPNVVAIYRVAEVCGHPYLVSEYVRGRALDQL